MEIRERIQQKAEELFRIYGIRSVTMDEIANQLGVSKKTIYQSFSDKNELVDAVINDMLERNKGNCKSCRTQASDAIKEAFFAIQIMREIMANMNPSLLFDLERGYPSALKKFVLFKYNFLYDIIMQNLEWGRADGLYRNDFNAEIYAKARLEMISLPFNEQLFPKSRFTMFGVQRELMEFFLYAIVTPKGLKLIEKYNKEQETKQIKTKQ